MKNQEIKKQMKEFRDLFGGGLLEADYIDSCQTKQELAELIDRHSHHIEMMCNDAQNHLERFKNKIGLSMMDLD
ncbi:MAG: hypothetical protein J7577_00805 [Sphingobacteriaceae bacterium]|nr:hypothetical protein [Sphingobacteriaceae bacterium]